MASGVDAVLAQLESAGFERLPSPLVVAGATFDFDAAARGTVYSHDLVVVALTSQAPARLVRLLSGLNLTLDRVSSRRPVTLVLLGNALDAPAYADLERNARVLTIESDDPSEEEIREAIAILLPLDIPPTGRQGRDALAEVEAVVGREWSEEHRDLVEAAASGSEAVRDAFQEYVDAAVTDPTGDEGHK